jgi:hypothetical protein
VYFIKKYLYDHTYCDSNENRQCNDDKEAEDENQTSAAFALKVTEPGNSVKTRVSENSLFVKECNQSGNLAHNTNCMDYSEFQGFRS